MSEIVTKIKPGDTVWWVHCSNRVYKGTVQSIDLCEYQGALYCHIYSPSFKRNPNPTVHYSFVFPDRQGALGFAEYQSENPDHTIPMCMGCHYNFMTAKEAAFEDEVLDG